MTEITVNCSKNYKVCIEHGLLGNAQNIVATEVPAKKYCIIADDNVAPLYSEYVADKFRSLGAETFTFTFTSGEDHKTLGTVEAILGALAEKHFTRSDCLVALGGGITGDITGFAASVYMRGIRFIQIPTTLLAAVDSSVGGKTGVNLNGLKNQIGAFWQPSLVLCDPDTFKTLPEIEMRNGVAEVIKYAAICDADMVDILDGDVCNIIQRCVQIKSDIVGRDEKDLGERMLLNYGHTFGHAIECASHERIPHGMAVAIGMVMASRFAEVLGACEKGVTKKTVDILKAHGLPYSADEFTTEQLFEAIKNDKKRSADNVTLVLPQKFGSCVLRKTTMDELYKVMKQCASQYNDQQ